VYRIGYSLYIIKHNGIMKHTFSTLLLLTFGISASAQNVDEAKVPAAVKAAFTKQFPTAAGAKWEMEDKDYEAEFKQGDVKYSATFSAAGTWMETEHAIKLEALPEAVRKAAAATYPDHKMDRPEMLETPSGTQYEVELKNGEKELEVVFAPDGKVLKSKVEDENGEKEDGKD